MREREKIERYGSPKNVKGETVITFGGILQLQ